MCRSVTGRPSLLLRLAAALGLYLFVLDPVCPVRAQDDAIAATAREHFEAGRAHLARGDSMAAHTAWRRGFEAIDARDAFDVRLGDAYLRSVFRLGHDAEQPAAARAYLRLIGRADSTDLTPVERRIIRRHVAQMVFLLTEAMQTRIAPDPEALMRDGGSLLPAAGERLAAWWRRQDPLPASLGNERIVEHLARVTYAEEHFADARRLVRFDERGAIYVRLGTPTHIERLESETLNFAGVCAGLAQTPENEYWIYDRLGESAQYLFVARGPEGYRLGTVRDLLPIHIRRVAATHNPCSRVKTQTALAALVDYYRQLATLRPEYLHQWSTISGYLDVLRENETIGRMNQSTSEAPLSPIPQEDLRQFAKQKLVEIRQYGRRFARRRAKEVPAVHTKMINTGDELRIATRAARFLDDDGTTRTEIYWAVDPADLTPSPAARLRLLQHDLDAPVGYDLQLTAVQYDAAYRAQTKHRTEHVVSAASEEPAVYSLALPGTPPPAHLALQWNQYTRSTDGDGRAFIRTGTQWIDSMRALPGAPDSLVLSDLVPLHAAELDADEPVRDDRGFHITPYPFDAVAPDTKLALYVEAYRLTPGPDDRTRYTIEYAITRRHERDDLSGFLLGGDESRVTAISSSHTGTSRTAREYTIIDLSAWKEADTLHMTVCVTDDVTGQRATRSLTFALTE